MSNIPYSLDRRLFFKLATLSAPVGFAVAEEPVAPPIPTFNQEMERALQSAPLRLRFRGETPTQLADWQRTFGDELRRRIGPHSPPTQWQSVSRGNVDCGDHVREEWLLTADGVPSLPLFVLKPKTPAGERLPVVLALHGHGPFGNESVVGIDDTPARAKSIQSANYDYRRQLVREGSGKADRLAIENNRGADGRTRSSISWQIEQSRNGRRFGGASRVASHARTTNISAQNLRGA